MAFVCGFFIAPSATLWFTSSVFCKWMVLRWYIYHVSFIYIWLVIPEFHISKVFVPAESLFIGCFWVVFWMYPPEMWSKWFEILTNDAMQSNAPDIWQLLFYSKEMVKTGPKHWFSGSFWEVFRLLHPLTPYDLRPNLQPN